MKTGNKEQIMPREGYIKAARKQRREGENHGC
jgi:hypothetical protein